jgi:hypothetical protein
MRMSEGDLISTRRRVYVGFPFLVLRCTLADFTNTLDQLDRMILLRHTRGRACQDVRRASSLAGRRNIACCQLEGGHIRLRIQASHGGRQRRSEAQVDALWREEALPKHGGTIQRLSLGWCKPPEHGKQACDGTSASEPIT